MKDTKLNKHEKQWIELFSLGKMYFLAFVMLVVFIYFLSNLFWNFMIFRILEEAKTEDRARKEQMKKELEEHVDHKKRIEMKAVAVEEIMDSQDSFSNAEHLESERINLNEEEEENEFFRNLEPENIFKK